MFADDHPEAFGTKLSKIDILVPAQSKTRPSSEPDQCRLSSSRGRTPATAGRLICGAAIYAASSDASTENCAKKTLLTTVNRSSNFKIFTYSAAVKEPNRQRQIDPHPAANPADVTSLDAIIAAAYKVISGSAGEQRDWQRERSLFISGARLIPTGHAPGMTTSTGELTPQLLDIDGYIDRVERYFRGNGFFEKEVVRRTEQFGRIAHVWSTYESRHNPEDPEPFMRGINSFQLFDDGTRWWIVSVYWQHESAEYPLPANYLPHL